MKLSNRPKYTALVVCALTLASGLQAQPLWDLANQNKDVLRIATLFTAQDVRDRLSTDTGINDAIDWCKKTGVTHAFIESFRDGYTAEKPALEHARDRFRAAGFDVSGCVTTTKVGKDSTGWTNIACYTDEPTQKHTQEIFEYTASMFDEIMIDDFWFTDCRCEECQKARGDKSWPQYHCDLMVKVSRERVLKPAKAVNPNVKIIIKYPQWYDQFHNRGYEVVQETADFDRIWVGTETRDYADTRWGGDVQYKGYYLMRWLGVIGGAKCGGGWFDPFGTHKATYVEQARQTVLADAKEMLLFCYGALLRGTGPANVEKLRTEVPDLLRLAKLVRNQPLRGIAAPKPPNSDAFDEQYVYDFAGMLGLPLIPTNEIRTDVKAAFLPVHVMKDPQWQSKLGTMLKAGTPVLVTDGLARKLPPALADSKNLSVLQVNGKPSSLLEMTREQLKPIRDKLLAPLGLRFDAPNKVALYLIGDDWIVVENFNDERIAATVEFPHPVSSRESLILPTNGEAHYSCPGARIEFNWITPRTLVAVAIAPGRTDVDINSGDTRSYRLSDPPEKAHIVESRLSKEIRRLGINIRAERKWVIMDSSDNGMYTDGVYAFVPQVGSSMIRLFDRTHTPDEERRAILEKYMTSVRTEHPFQAQEEGYLLMQEVADKHGLHLFDAEFEKGLRAKLRSRKSKE